MISLFLNKRDELRNSPFKA